MIFASSLLKCICGCLSALLLMLILCVNPSVEARADDQIYRHALANLSEEQGNELATQALARLYPEGRSEPEAKIMRWRETITLRVLDPTHSAVQHFLMLDDYRQYLSRFIGLPIRWSADGTENFLIIVSDDPFRDALTKYRILVQAFTPPSSSVEELVNELRKENRRCFFRLRLSAQGTVRVAVIFIPSDLLDAGSLNCAAPTIVSSLLPALGSNATEILDRQKHLTPLGQLIFAIVYDEYNTEIRTRNEVIAYVRRKLSRVH